MISKPLSTYTRTLLIVFVALLLIGDFPSDAVSGENAKKNIRDDIHPVGIISPDGATNLWPVSKSYGSHIFNLLVKHPSKMIEGVKFYQMSSWQDLARILTAVNEHQTQVIWRLAQDVRQLNKRVRILEKKRRGVVYSGSLDYRVKALEKKLKDSFDGGLP